MQNRKVTKFMVLSDHPLAKRVGLTEWFYLDLGDAMLPLYIGDYIIEWEDSKGINHYTVTDNKSWCNPCEKLYNELEGKNV